MCTKGLSQAKSKNKNWWIKVISHAKKQIKSVVKKLKAGDGIEVEWVDASDDEGDLTNFTWNRRTDVLEEWVTFGRTEVNNETTLYLLQVATVEKAKSLSDL